MFRRDVPRQCLWVSRQTNYRAFLVIRREMPE